MGRVEFIFNVMVVISITTLAIVITTISMSNFNAVIENSKTSMPTFESIPSTRPSTTPTTSAPSGSPSNLPSMTPTINTPTKSPSITLPTKQPSSTLTMAPTTPTQQPSSTPTKSPLTLTEQPSLAPTCIPGTVFCCFAVTQSVAQLYINDIDYTNQVVPAGGNPLVSLSYTLQFTEPSNTAVFALKGFESSEVFDAGLRLKCTCDRLGSPWNFVSESESTGASAWKQVKSIRTPNWQANNFPSDWQTVNYTGQKSGAQSYAGNPLALNLTTEACGAQNASFSLGHGQGGTSPRSWYWVLRKLVKQTITCGTDAPISSPTFLPSVSPSSTLPSSVPTTTPTGSAPSGSPSNVPSSAPTIVTNYVTCCFSVQQELLQIYIDEVDVSSDVVPNTTYAFENANVTKTYSFVEPTGFSAIAIKGYGINIILGSNLISNVKLVCNSTNPASKWNFISLRGTGPESWKTVLSTTALGDDLPPQWFNITYTGDKEPAGTDVSEFNYDIDDSCGELAPAGVNVRPGNNFPIRRYWAMRKWITPVDYVAP